MLRSRALLNHKIRLLFVLYLLFYFLNILTAFVTLWLRVIGAYASKQISYCARLESRKLSISSREKVAEAACPLPADYLSNTMGACL
jgi:hypothetical protein